MVRLYLVEYQDLENDQISQSVVPEWLLPEIEEIYDISVAGYLMPGYTIVEDEEPDPGEKEPLIVNLASRS